jgi:hypothetical protein
VKTDASARQSEMNRAMPHELNTKCADETFPYVETRNAWQFSNSGKGRPCAADANPADMGAKPSARHWQRAMVSLRST